MEQKRQHLMSLLARLLFARKKHKENGRGPMPVSDRVLERLLKQLSYL